MYLISDGRSEISEAQAWARSASVIDYIHRAAGGGMRLWGLATPPDNTHLLELVKPPILESITPSPRLQTS